MRVLHVYSGNLFGGIERLLTVFAGRNGEAGLHHEFALCFSGRLKEDLERAGVVVHDLGTVRASRPLSIMRARRNLRSVLNQGDFACTIFHAPWPMAMLGPAARSSGVPLIWWQQDRATGRHWIERWARLTEPDLVIANSRYTASTTPAIYPAVEAVPLYLPVEPPPPVSETERTSCRRTLGAMPDDVVILQAGRLDPLKGHQQHLEALAALGSDLRWKCWMTGGVQRPEDARYLADLQESARRMGIAGRVDFLGDRSDVRLLMASSDVFCQPNTRPEAFGIAFIEALYAGLPVVASAIGSASEVVPPSCGFTLEPRDVNGLAAALGQLVESGDLRRRMGAAGRRHAVAISDPAARLQDLATSLQRVTSPDATTNEPPIESGAFSVGAMRNTTQGSK